MSSHVIPAGDNGPTVAKKSKKGHKKPHRHHQRNFLLGGNARDPLGLEKLTNEEGEEIEPKDIKRPVHIDINTDITSGKRNKRRRKRQDSGKNERQLLNGGECFSDSEISVNARRQTMISPDIPCKRTKFHDKSPDLPVPSPTKASSSTPKTSTVAQEIKFDADKKKKDKSRFRYGNYMQYYGKRLENEQDPRVKYLNREWFENRVVLDIGCNAGFLTSQIAQTYNPALIVGMDIDQNLIGMARRNLHHIVAPPQKNKYPNTFYKTYGPLTAPLPHEYKSTNKFPRNIAYKEPENYVLESDSNLDEVRPEYECILALSITKWVQLNWGDHGLMRFFKRAFLNLKPGGTFILEPQPLNSYKRRCNLTPEMRDNYSKIELTPDDYIEYLLKKVGFQSYETVATPNTKAKGFQRPILVFQKGFEADKTCEK